jgi:SAM-dependent methyltransferase
MTDQSADVQTMKDRQRVVWGLGDYGSVSEWLRPAAEALCDACAVSAGQEVLDVAAGDGNFALACAREGATVVASDLSPKMLERGRRRSEAEGFDVEWVEADAEDLPFEDDRFDCVGSVFGAMIAPRPEVVARELFRVVRPGNTVGMTAWTPESFNTQLFGIARSYLPAGLGRPPEEWGDEDIVRARFDGLAGSLEMERRTLPLEGASAEALYERFVDSPPQVAARGVLAPEIYRDLEREQAELIRSVVGDGPASIDCEYLLIVARRRG